MLQRITSRNGVVDSTRLRSGTPVYLCQMRAMHYLRYTSMLYTYCLSDPAMRARSGVVFRLVLHGHASMANNVSIP